MKVTGDVKSDDDILKHAQKLPNTDRRMTAAYYFVNKSAPYIDNDTSNGQIYYINEILYESPQVNRWDYAYMRNLNGSEVFVNCNKEPSNDLCRK